MIFPWSVRFRIVSPLASLPCPLRLEHVFVSSRNAFKGSASADCHHIHRILVAIRGEGTCSLQEAESPIRSGWALLIPHFTSGYTIQRSGDSEDEISILCLDFSGVGATEMVEYVNRRHGHFFAVSPRDHAIQNLWHFRHMAGAVATIHAFKGAQLVLDILSRFMDDVEKTNSRDSSGAIVRMAEYFVLGNLERSVTVEGVARELRMSREHISRLFKQVRGVSLSEYIRRERIVLACHRLKESSYSCKELASRLGYGNSSSLARVFREYMGVSPSEFRRNGVLEDIPGFGATKSIAADDPDERLP